MGDKQNQPFQLSFNAALKVDFQGSRVTSDGGLILLRSGNVHSADGWEELLLPEGPEGAPRQQKQGKDVVFRADAAFARPEIYETLEERGAKYAIRLPARKASRPSR
jgi:hypothetical protein